MVPIKLLCFQYGESVDFLRLLMSLLFEYEVLVFINFLYRGQLNGEHEVLKYVHCIVSGRDHKRKMYDRLKSTLRIMRKVRVLPIAMGNLL